MKKLLLALVAMTMTAGAFADGHSMIRLDGCADGRCDALDFYNSSLTKDSTTAADDVKKQTIALNYAMAFAGNYGAGIKYVSQDNKTDGKVASVGDKSSTIGLSFYWNKDGSFSDSCFAALHYDMITKNDNDTTDKSGNKQTEIALEFGHRYPIGKAMFGFQMNWSPSVTYTMNTTDHNADSVKDDKTTSLAFNMANFAATF